MAGATRAILALALLAAAAAPAPATAGQPGANGAIAFVGERGDERVVYIRKDGRTVGLLRERGLADPAWSPLGLRLAITRERPDSGRAVWILNGDGSGARQLTPSERAGAGATWAPGGERLAYAAGPVGARTIHTIGADGNDDRQLTPGPEDQYAPAWSRRGVIAFVQDGAGGEDVYTVPARGGPVRRLTSKPGDDTDPAWSPRGDRIAFVRGTGGIWVMNAYGGAARRVAHVRGGIEEGVAWAPDGRRLVFAGGPPGARQVYTVRLDGKGLRPLSLPTSNGEDPVWRSVGHDPVIAAAGDMTCSPVTRAFNGGVGTRSRCAGLRTSDLLLRRDLSAVLALGDVQVPSGQLDYYFRAFGPSWGRLKPIVRPSPGNHDYGTSGAAGYFDYFNGVGRRRGPAGDRRRGGYYRFSLGQWQIIALDSNCTKVPGGCEAGSPQQRWLERVLARSDAACTLAFWHHPRFSSVAVEGGRSPRRTIALWQTLYDGGADVVLSGHQHFYERLASQDGNGLADPVRGIRSFVVGTGGHSLDDASFTDANSQLLDNTTFGVLELELHPRSYSWRFRGAGPGSLADEGRGVCR